MYHGPLIDAGGRPLAAVVEAIAALSAKQREALAAYVFDRLTQREIGEQHAVPQSTVSKRILVARQRLAAAGVTVSLPGKGRRPARVARVDPAAIERLEAEGQGDYASGRDGDGYAPATWRGRRDPTTSR